MKICKWCEIKRPMNDFHKNKPSKDGHLNKCKYCCHEYIIDYYKNNKDDISEKVKHYRQKNPNEVALQKRIYRSSDKGKETKLKNKNKYPNAYISRNYFHTHNKNHYPILCSSCKEETKVQAHHSDYNKPMEVINLCKQCHADWHMTNTPLNRVTGIFTEKKA